MAIINKGTAFSNGEQLSASKLNALIDDATFGTDSVDNSSTLVNANGAITVRDSGITAAKLTANSVTTAKIADANVTFEKLTDVIDDDTMDTATDTTLATSESIKAYVDSLGLTTTLPSQSGGLSTEGEQGSINVGPLIMKYGTINSDSFTVSYSFTTAFPTAIIGVNATVNENVSSSSETCSVIEQSTTGFDLTGYRGTSGNAVGRVFWQAFGY